MSGDLRTRIARWLYAFEVGGPDDWDAKSADVQRAWLHHADNLIRETGISEPGVR